MAGKGLEGVVVGQSKLSDIDGEVGELIYAGYDIDDLARNTTFEEVCYLLWNGELPNRQQLDGFKRELAANARLDDRVLAVLRTLPDDGDPMAVLRTAVSALGTFDPKADDISAEEIRRKALYLTAVTPTLVAASARLRHGKEPLQPKEGSSFAANFLYMLNGETPEPERVRALETYLNTVVDHGLNASTFTARVIISTGSDLVSAVVGALGALKGPLHGGAPGPALDMVFEIGEASRAEAFLRKKIEAGEKLMGFGHRVYKVRDPRADVLATAAERMYTRTGDMSLYTLARNVETTAIRLLDEYKPGRRLQTNVEFYTALLLHGLGLEVPLFTPTFAISRVSGWIAHALEQQRANRIIRPQSEYVGPRDRRWVPSPDPASAGLSR